MSLIKNLLILIIALISIQGYSQLSKKHYIPPLTYADADSSTPQDQYIYLSTPRNSDVPYTIIPVGQPAANYITGVVNNNNPSDFSSKRPIDIIPLGKS